MNPREFEILNLLSSRKGAADPPLKPVRLAQEMTDEPGAPALADLMAVAVGTAADDMIAVVTAWCRARPDYGEMLESFRRFARDEDPPEPQYEGSILERMVTSSHGLTLPSPGVETEAEYLPLDEAAEARGVSSEALRQAIAGRELIGEDRQGITWVRAADLRLWQPQKLSRPAYSAGSAIAVSAPGPRADTPSPIATPAHGAWLSRPLASGEVLFVVDPSAVTPGGPKAGDTVRADLPPIAVAGTVRYADADVVLIAVPARKATRAS